jgi:hypothetical protein
LIFFGNTAKRHGNISSILKQITISRQGLLDVIVVGLPREKLFNIVQRFQMGIVAHPYYKKKIKKLEDIDVAYSYLSSHLIDPISKYLTGV